MAEETITTRAQAEAVIRQIQRRCRGPISADDQTVVLALLHEGKMQEAHAYDDAHRGIPVPTADGMRYAPCNQDVNDLICAEAIDGKEHVVTCPRCGIAISYRVAWFPDLPPEEVAAPQKDAA